MTKEYSRFKHWFQEEDPTKISDDSAVVIVMFRDPYNWVEAMRVEPHHAHDHVDWPKNKEYNHTMGWRDNGGLPLQWKEFVTKPWIGRRGPIDAKIGTTQESMEHAECMDSYSYWDAAPCSAKDSTVSWGWDRTNMNINMMDPNEVLVA